MAIRFKLGEMFAVPSDTYYEVAGLTSGLSSYAADLYQVFILANRGVADVSLNFFYEETGDISPGNDTVTINEIASSSTTVLSFTSDYIVSTQYDHIIRPDATELKLIKVIFKNVNIQGTFSEKWGDNACFEITMDERFNDTPAYSIIPPEGSYYFTDADGNRVYGRTWEGNYKVGK